MRHIKKITSALIVFIFLTGMPINAQCWTLVLTSTYINFETGFIWVEQRVLASWCDGAGGTTSPTNPAIGTPAAQLLINAKDCVKSYLQSLGFGTDPSNCRLGIQSTIASNPTPTSNQLANITEWQNRGTPFTYSRTDGSLGLNYDLSKIRQYKISNNEINFIKDTQQYLLNTSSIPPEIAQQASAKINSWLTQASQMNGASAITYYSLGRSLGSQALDEAFLLGHEMGHIMAQSENLGNHPDNWIDPVTGNTRIDLANSSAPSIDTFGVMLAADAKAKAESISIEEALRRMGLNGLADAIASKFGSGGC